MRVILHPSDLTHNPYHFNLLEDKLFIKTFQNLDLELLYSNKATILPDDVIIYLEAKYLLNIKDYFKEQDFLFKLKFLVKKILNKPFNFKAPLKTNKNQNLKILLVFEGHLHAPENHSVKLRSKCDYILTWNDDLVDNIQFFKMQIPQPSTVKEVSQISYDKKKLLVNISANKKSHKKGELYTERLKIIKESEQLLGEEFDLFGVGWDKSSFMNKGEVTNKSNCLSNYKYALTYENYCHKGYITEKIFDCMRSNCVPIYYGAPNITDYVPSNTFIDRRNFNSDIELLHFLNKINEEEYNQILQNIRIFLQSDKFKEFLPDKIVHSIHKLIFRNVKTNN